ncbi:MAG: tetratricopeptide repeat protein [Fibrella sp.]|nr:tetratricopeptide repeat protein [Armatimonadota bacterium]
MFLNRISRKRGVSLAILPTLGMVALMSMPTNIAWAQPLQPGETMIFPALVVAQAGTEAEAEAALAAGNSARAISIYSTMIQATPKKFTLYLKRGIAYYGAKQFDKAADDFGQFITLRPALIEGYLNRAYAYKELGKADEGLADLAKVQSLDAGKVDEKLRGDLYLAKKDFPNAITAYTKIAAKGGPDGGVAYLLIGDAYAAQGDNANALANYTKGITAAPKNPYGYAQRGRSYVQAKQYDLGIKDLTQYITLAPGEPYGYYLRGLANVSLKTPAGYAAAKTDLTKYITLEKNPANALIGTKLLADAQRETDDHRGAVESYSKIIAANNKESNALFLRGMSYMSLKDYPNATKDFQTYATAFPTGPNAGDAAYNLGSAYLLTKDYDKAVPAYTAAIKIDNKDAASYYGRMIAYNETKAYDKVVPDSEAVILNADPKSEQFADAHLKQASAYDSLAKAKGDKSLGAKALATMKKYVALRPKDTNGAAYYQDLVSLYSDPATQIAEYTIVLGTPPTDPKAAANLYFNRGAAYSQTKQYDLAIADFNKVATLTPSDKEVYIYLAQNQALKGDTENAIASYTKAIPLNPENADLVVARASLYVDKQDAASFAKADTDLTAYETKVGSKVDPDILLLHARIKRSLGKPDDAIAMYVRHLAVEKDPALITASTKELGGVYFAKKDYANAIKTYSDYLSKNGKDAPVLASRATAYRLTDDTDKAMADANAALAIEPNSAMALTERGLINNKIGDKVGDADPDKAGAAWDAAIADCDKAIAANAKYSLAYYCKGFAAYKNASDKGKADTKYLDTALDAFNKFLQVAPPTDPLIASAKSAVADIKVQKGG